MNVTAIAHRAANSLAGLETAIAMGADVIECDVHEHRGRLEVRHLKTAGPLPFLWDKWELAPASAPRLLLGQLLEAGLDDVTLMLDLKGRRRSTARAVAEQLNNWPRPIWVCGRYWPAVDFVAAMPQVRGILSARNRRELALLRRRLAGAAAFGVSVHESMLTRDIVAELAGRVEIVMTWPVNDVPTLDRLLGLGVSGIISDEAEVLAELIRRRGQEMK